jgi:hypothetical protein
MQFTRLGNDLRRSGVQIYEDINSICRLELYIMEERYVETRIYFKSGLVPCLFVTNNCGSHIFSLVSTSVVRGAAKNRVERNKARGKEAIITETDPIILAHQAGLTHQAMGTTTTPLADLTVLFS